MFFLVAACVCGQTFLFHSRKAGGTTLRAALPNAVVEEGYNIQRKKQPGELWVTSIRDPVDRLWSSFRYEGRWKGTRFSGWAEKEISFNEWHARTNSTTCSRKTWQCSANCFTRWFSGCTSGPTHNAFPAAALTLSEFDVVVNMHRLQDATYAKLVQECLNLTRPIRRVSPWLAQLAIEANKKYPISTPARLPLVAENALDYALLQPYWEKPPCNA